MDFSANGLESLAEWAGGFIVTYGLRLLGAIITLIIGFWVVSRIAKAIRNLMEKRNLDPSLRGFLSTLISIGLKILVVISVLGMVGIEMTSFIAILGAAGLAIGLALSGTLQNFAGGVLILILKPFKVGDFIEAQGFMGSVENIQIFNTILVTPSNQVITIPNGGLATEAVTNYSAKPTRRAEWVFGIAYGDKYPHARSVLLGLIQEDSRILKEPAPFIAISELNDSSVDIKVRVWVNSDDFWSVFFEMNEKVYDAFEKEGINIPFPQMDVHLSQEKAQGA
ncbi:MAG: mechanosensitive ion channel [Bacteroidales bacterium]